MAKVRDEMEEKAFELYEPKVEGQVLRERVKESEQEFREKEGMLKAATEQEAREAVDGEGAYSCPRPDEITKKGNANSK